MKTFASIIAAWLAFAAIAFSQNVPLNIDETTSVIPNSRTNFFWANRGPLTNALVAAGFSGGGGGGGSVFVDGAGVTNPNFDSTWYERFSVSGSDVSIMPSTITTASGTSATPNAAVTDEFVYTMTGNFTLNAISNVNTNHSKRGIEFILIQGGSGGYQPSFATNYLFNDRYPGATIVWTNVGYRCLLRVKPRRDQPAVYDVTDFIDGMIP